MPDDPLTLAEFEREIERLHLYDQSGEVLYLMDRIREPILRLLEGERERVRGASGSQEPMGRSALCSFHHGEPDMTKEQAAAVTQTPREVIAACIADALTCSLCAAPLPNPGCGHKANGVFPCCYPAVDDGADNILSALAAAGIGTYDTRTQAVVPRKLTKKIGWAIDAADCEGGLPPEEYWQPSWDAAIAAAEAEAKGGE